MGLDLALFMAVKDMGVGGRGRPKTERLPPPDWLGDYAEDLVKIMLNLETAEEVKALFQIFFTSREFNWFIRRIRAAILLSEGFTPVQIEHICNSEGDETYISVDVIRRAGKAVEKMRSNGSIEDFKRSYLRLEAIQDT